ncbi:type 4a pilus biogenesis protein PilO [Oceanospirillum sp.]|uniref:type 4a pilus biogenesis protein PilO n=1 Tax=Oceanospirillum sp. TaxID=2021254 RepID=UPI003A901B28
MTTNIPMRRYPLKTLLERLLQTDLTEIDFRSAGSWPKAGKVLAWILTVIITALPGYLLYLSPKFERLDQAGKHREQLLNNYKAQASLVAYLTVYKRQLQGLQRQDHNQTSQIPTGKSIPQFMEQVGTQAQLYGVDLHTFKLGDGREHKIYQAQPITLTVKGSYHNLAQFLSAITQLDRLATLHDFRLQPSDNQLNLSIEVRVYHLEQDNQQQGERHD